MSLLYWPIGKRIKTEVLDNEKAGYGKAVFKKLSAMLTAEYSPGWSERQLHNCLRCAEAFPDIEILHSVRAKLNWTHIKSIIYIDDILKREFYIEMCRLEKWSSRQLQERIQSMLYERTAISKKPEKTILNDLAALKKEQKLSNDLLQRLYYNIQTNISQL